MVLGSPKIIIIGAGPCGFGGAFYLHNTGYGNWKIYEREPFIGGLSASFKDSNGFTWDQGGHVCFSHYEFFDRLFNFSCGDDFFTHNRNAFAYMYDRLVPYPVQNNIRHFPKDKILDCINGLLDLIGADNKPANFYDWIYAGFGQGLADCFMAPYNRKVWQYPLNNMSFNWIGERVSVIDIKNVLKNLILEQDDACWGPNSAFKFPKYGGTQSIFSPVAKLIGDKLAVNYEVERINIKEKKIYFTNGIVDNYDYLISTIPIDTLFMDLLEGDGVTELKDTASGLAYNTVSVVGIGIAGKNNLNRCWVYFPEDEFPWYRVTYFSNYSRYNVPGENFFSLMGEISYPAGSLPNPESEIEGTIPAFLKCGFISKEDIHSIASVYHKLIPKAYPIPTLNRDNILSRLQSFLMKNNILSRGRFGGWKYEVANMDHSVMQGKEAVERILFNEPENVYKF